MGFKLTKKQSDAVLLALNWYYSSKSIERPLIIAGLAGSGKSSVIRYICETLGLLNSNILYTALTGKAVSVLRMKGHMANTIHKSFYNAKPFKNTVFFKKKQSLPRFIKLIIIDEFGMVGDSMIEDILSFGIPTIGVGDHLQLPPIFQKNSYMIEEHLDIFLDEVMRADDNSGILTIAMDSRNRKDLVPGTYCASRVLECKDDLKPMLDYDKVLCWTNKTRKYLNKMIRHELGIMSRYPLAGEKIVFLGNRYDINIEYLGIDICIVNGMECTVLEDSLILNDDQIAIKAKPTFIEDDDLYFDVECHRAIFDSYEENIPNIKKIMETDRENEIYSVFCDFAYAITCTSSQGSEWPNILVIDEMNRWRPEYYRWMYTAITRASKSVDVLLNQSKRY